VRPSGGENRSALSPLLRKNIPANIPEMRFCRAFGALTFCGGADRLRALLLPGGGDLEMIVPTIGRKVWYFPNEWDLAAGQDRLPMVKRGDLTSRHLREPCGV
jgi:hypothetical protein